MKFKIASLFLASVLLVSLTLLSCINREKNIVATVNGENITADDFLSELAVYRMKTDSLNIAANDPKYLEIKKDILNSMIRERILLSAAKSMKITATETEVESAINQIRKDYPGDSFMKQLRDNGINYGRWKDKIKDSIIIDNLTKAVTGKDFDIKEEEIAEYYEKYKDDFVEPEKVRAFQIVVKTEEEAYRIYRELKKGKKFEDLAREYSITPEASDGGDIGFFTRASVPKVFENILFKLRQGRISKVIASEYGYHILKVAEKKPKEQKKLEQVKESIRQKLIDRKKSEAFSSWFKEKITKAQIKRNNMLLANIK